MPNASHWLSASALVVFVLTAVLSVFAALQPGLSGLQLAIIIFAPILIWFVAARQAGITSDARRVAAESLASVQHLAELSSVNTDQPPRVLGQAIAEQDTANRNALINQLTQVYVLMHRDVSQSIVEGSEPPPVDWLNERLEKLGLNWRVRITSNGELESYAP